MTLIKEIIEILVEGIVMLWAEDKLDNGNRVFLSGRKSTKAKICIGLSIFIGIALLMNGILQFSKGNPLEGAICMLFETGIILYFIVLKENYK